MNNKNKFTCNQCFKQMGDYVFSHDLEESKHVLEVCDNPKCPNFALLQVPVEKLKEL